MKFLIDNQLPIHLRAKGHAYEHVLDAGLDEADDLTLWTHATRAGQIVVSKMRILSSSPIVAAISDG